MYKWNIPVNVQLKSLPPKRFAKKHSRKRSANIFLVNILLTSILKRGQLNVILVNDWSTVILVNDQSRETLINDQL